MTQRPLHRASSSVHSSQGNTPASTTATVLVGEPVLWARQLAGQPAPSWPHLKGLIPCGGGFSSVPHARTTNLWLGAPTPAREPTPAHSGPQPTTLLSSGREQVQQPDTWQVTHSTLAQLQETRESRSSERMARRGSGSTLPPRQACTPQCCNLGKGWDSGSAGSFLFIPSFLSSSCLPAFQMPLSWTALCAWSHMAKPAPVKPVSITRTPPPSTICWWCWQRSSREPRLEAFKMPGHLAGVRAAGAAPWRDSLCC